LSRANLTIIFVVLFIASLFLPHPPIKTASVNTTKQATQEATKTKEELEKEKQQQIAEAKRLQEEQQHREKELQAQKAKEKEKQLQAEKAAEIKRIKQQKIIDEAKTKLATQYCKEREDIHRKYPMAMIKDEDGDSAFDIKNAKFGDELTIENCKKIIDFMLNLRKENLLTASAETKRIIEGRIWVDMGKNDLVLSAGIPNDINTTTHNFGVNEQWVYNKDAYGIRAFYVYVDNGKVTSYQDF